MSEKVLISRSTMESIGDAIREASGTSTQYLPAQMPEAIRNLGGGDASLAAIAPSFSETAQYYIGDLVIYNKVLFKFTAPHFGAWTGTDAVVTSVSNELSETMPYSVPVTLALSGWQNNTQTVTVSGILADESAQLIQPVPYVSSRAAYNAAGIEATAQGANSLTFTCTTVPSVSLSVYVVITPLAG